jgi:3-polyprenyl-4-hydroxybenzoate decarboxylase
VSERWIRSQRAAVVEIRDDVLLVDRAGVVRRIEADSAELARVVLAFLGQPHAEPEVIAHVESLAGPLGERRAVVHQLVGLLAETGAIGQAITGSEAIARARGANIVIAASGAIAASSVPALASALQRRGHAIEVALTETATRFVAIDALAAIVQREPQTSMWPRAAHAPVPHVALAEWADLVVVYPASATTISRIAHGHFSDLVAAIALTTRAPVVIAPSMNPDMLDAPAVQRNLEELRVDGFAIVGGVPSQEVDRAPRGNTLRFARESRKATRDGAAISRSRNDRRSCARRARPSGKPQA